ncbi:uncharacterized protein [Coffea arabica]|uniref:Uncharacterized protein n=1 Tax=Coffea arabica TaxID=13443 RepID=A0ABM4VVD0_COFAR
MHLKNLICRQTFNNISKFNRRKVSSLPRPLFNSRNANFSTSSSLAYRSNNSTRAEVDNFVQPSWIFNRCISTSQGALLRDSSSKDDELEEDEATNEFLSRFVWIMRGKLSEAYPESDRKTIDAMLLIIVEKVVSEMEKGGVEGMTGTAAATPSEDFSEDLWRTVWEVSQVVLEDMQKAQKKEKMKKFLQSDDVKEMCRFAGEIGIRGDMLRELRFKWAREKMEQTEFYEGLEKLKEEAKEGREEVKSESRATEEDGVFLGAGSDDSVNEEVPNVVTLPKRHGKLKYKIYGLDLSDSKWAEVADKIHRTEEVILPQEPQPISGKCKILTDKILSLQIEDDPSQLLAEWVELLQPGRIDWITLLDKLKERSTGLYLKIAELILGEESFQANIRDYSKLVDAHACENRSEDVERILKKMNENGISPDVLTLTTLVHMYTKAGNLDRAKETFESLKHQGLHPDMRVCNSMITSYINAGLPKSGESLMRDLEKWDIKPTEEIYMALLKSFSQLGDVNGAVRIASSMHFAGIQPNLESCTLVIEAYAKTGDLNKARQNFDNIIKLGLKPDDRCTASMIAAYARKNLLDKALHLLLQLEKDGFEPGVATYSVFVDWLGKLQMVDEAEQLLNKIAELGEAPPFNVHISLCEMYSRAGIEKKALQALGVMEAKKDQLGKEGFTRIIQGLNDGGFVEDAKRMLALMKAEGISVPESLQISMMSSTIGLKTQGKR